MINQETIKQCNMGLSQRKTQPRTATATNQMAKRQWPFDWKIEENGKLL